MKKSRRICEAFAKGCGGRVVGPERLLPGDLFMYGKPSLIPLLRPAMVDGRTWYYADNCYLGPRNAYFRVTRNARQHNGRGNAGPERWERLGLEIKPWREDGRHILICPPAPDYITLWGDVDRDWLEQTKAKLAAVTDRPIVIRERSLARSTEHPLAADLENCWALVTCASNVAVQALLSGIPVFCTHPCAAYDMGWPTLAHIEQPFMLDREQWAWNLAANQWTIAEMRDGTCWRSLNQ